MRNLPLNCSHIANTYDEYKNKNDDTDLLSRFRFCSNNNDNKGSQKCMETMAAKQPNQTT